MFSHLIGKKIVIYGTGHKTDEFLKQEKELHIIGLMDSIMTGEIVYGQKVLDHTEAAQADAIIIVAGNAVLRIIYKRIRLFAQKNNIEVYDITGKRININIGGVSRSLTRFGYEDLISDIDYHDIISFDLFDTLIMRQIYRPADIFRVVERRLREKYDIDIPFFYTRINSEKKLSATGVPDINEIYRDMNVTFGLSDYILRLVMQEEMDTEFSFIVPRHKIIEAFNYAVNAGKKVLIVTDMYYHEDFISQILNKCGIKGYTGLYVSCDYGTGKAGKLFSIVKKSVGRGRHLHIGDDSKADISRPSTYGINTFRVFSAVDMFEHSLFMKSMYVHNSKENIIENSIVMGMFITRAFNDPFVLHGGDGRLTVGSEDMLAELFIAPVLMGYTVWLIQQIRSLDIDKILYPSRDGFLIQRLIDLIVDRSECSVPKGQYFYTSRYAAVYGSVAYKNYVKKCFGTKKTAIIDFLAEGTIQYNLQKVLQEQPICMYFLKRISSNEYYNKMKYMTYYSQQMPYDSRDNVYRGHLFLETILSSYEPSFKNMTGNYNKLFYPESRTKEQITSLKYIHNSIERYFSDYLTLDNRLFDRKFDRALADMLYGYIFSEYTCITSDRINSLELSDEFRKQRFKSTSQI